MTRLNSSEWLDSLIANRLASKDIFHRGTAISPVRQLLQIMVTTDDNKMHQKLAFPGIKFQNFHLPHTLWMPLASRLRYIRHLDFPLFSPLLYVLTYFKLRHFIVTSALGQHYTTLGHKCPRASLEPSSTCSSTFFELTEYKMLKHEKSANLQAKHTATTATRNRRRPEIGTLELSPWLPLMKLISISRYRF